MVLPNILDHFNNFHKTETNDIHTMGSPVIDYYPCFKLQTDALKLLIFRIYSIVRFYQFHEKNSTIFLMNIWYIHLVVSNLNWMITTFAHIISLMYNVYSFWVNSPPEEPLENIFCAITVKMIVGVIYLLMCYFSDHQRKLSYCIQKHI